MPISFKTWTFENIDEMSESLAAAFQAKPYEQSISNIQKLSAVIKSNQKALMFPEFPFIMASITF